ncbi:MAG: energy transducer TonB, partial [Saprospiraceae bacterium]
MLLAATTHAQYGVETHPRTGKKGYVDQFDGSIIVPLEYDEVKHWKLEPFILVTKGSKKGLFHAKGGLAVPAEYDQIDMGSVKQGYAGVAKGYLWGLHNLEGELILPLQYEYTRAVYPELLAAREAGDSLLQFFDGQGVALFKAKGLLAGPGFDPQTVEIVQTGGMRYFLDLKGQDPFQGRFAEGRWTDGKTVICAPFLSRDKFGPAGLFSWEGDTLLPPVYFNIQALPGSTFLVKTTDNKMGLVDDKGHFLIPLGEATLSKMGNQPDDVVLGLGKTPFDSKVYSPDGRLLLSDCMTGNVTYQRGIVGEIANRRFERYFTASTETGSTKGLFHLDGRPILPMQYKYIQYASDDHPLIVSDGEAHTIVGWDGKPAYPGRFRQVAYTIQPGILYGTPENSELEGFIHIEEPAGDHFTYKRITPLTPSGYYSVRDGDVYYLHDPVGNRLNNQGFVLISQPIRQHYEAWRAQKKAGKLVAFGAQTLDFENQPWVGFDEKGKAHDFSPLQPKEEVVMVEEVVVMSVPPPPPPPPAVVSPRQEEEIYDFPDQPAEYPGGDAERLKFMVSELKYPALAKENAIQGMVVVKFVVEKDGSLTNIQIVRDIGGGCGREVERIIRLMPRWKPA